ncbi:MAG TPA: hypothetical protein VHA09_01650 [Nitrososphaera sp.]|nr:hypothetical protein [Nitrososphaera sp.]
MSSPENPDIRQAIKTDSGTLKKLQLLVPGLRGYRNSEDIRIADELLRNQVSDRLDQAKAGLESTRKQMVAGGDFANLTAIGAAISQLQQLAGEIRHSQQGYSGLAPSISITPDVLNRLYEYDYAFVDSANQLLGATVPPGFTYDPTAPGNVLALASRLTAMIAETRQRWSARMEAVEKILQK